MVVLVFLFDSGVIGEGRTCPSGALAGIAHQAKAILSSHIIVSAYPRIGRKEDSASDRPPVA